MAIWGSHEDQFQDSDISAAISKDLDTPRLLLRLRAIEKDAKIPNELKRSIYLYADRLLGLDLARKIPTQLLTPEQEQLLKSRELARQAKDWSESDRLRDLLAASGVAINDGPDGQTWVWI